MEIILSREELCEKLDVTNEGLKKIIKRGKLEDRINSTGEYKYIESFKEGRRVFYRLEINKDFWAEFQAYYKIKKKKEHTLYSLNRLNDLQSSRSSLLKEYDINISLPTAKKYDDILLNENAMEEDKMVYFLIDTQDDTMTEITKDEYEIFWKDNKVTQQALANINRKRSKYEISESFADYSKYTIIRDIGNKEGSIAIKFMTYKEAENSIKMLNFLKAHIKNNKKINKENKSIV